MQHLHLSEVRGTGWPWDEQLSKCPSWILKIWLLCRTELDAYRLCSERAGDKLATVQPTEAGSDPTAD